MLPTSVDKCKDELIYAQMLVREIVYIYMNKRRSVCVYVYVHCAQPQFEQIC